MAAGNGRAHEVVERYRLWMAHREYSAATVEKYARALRRFLAEGGSVRPSREEVAAWRDGLAARGYAPSSVNAMLAAVNGFLESQGRGTERARPLRRQRRAFRDAGRELVLDEYRRLLETARAAGDERALLLLQTLCSTGIRVSELPAITVEALRRGRASVRCKGKCREILLTEGLRRLLVGWCRRQGIRSGPVFLTRAGRPLGRVTVWRLLKGLCPRAGVNPGKVFPHNLRRLFATTFYRQERDLSKLADLMGHSSIETTRVYVMESGAEHERMLNRMRLLL